MTGKAIGVVIEGRNVLASIREAEALGIQAVWLESSPLARDPLTLFAAAASQTSRIKLGTAILPIAPRHPLAVAQQIRVLGELALAASAWASASAPLIWTSAPTVLG